MSTSTPHRRRSLGRAVRLAFLLVVALGALSLPATAAGRSAASEAVPCWKKLINDWYDGRIDHSYRMHCYTQALDHLPEDVRAYSDAYDVISRALASAKRENPDKQDALIPPPPDAGGGSGSGGNGGSGGTGTSKEPLEGRTTADGGFLNDATDSLGSSRADSVPVPLLVLAGLALLLVAAGAAGLVARRIQARRAQP